MVYRGDSRSEHETNDGGRSIAGTVAACAALASFTIATVAGLSCGNAAKVVLVRSIVSMLLCYPIGFAIGIVLDRVIRQQFERHREANAEPIDDEMPSEDGDEDVIVV